MMASRCILKMGAAPMEMFSLEQMAFDRFVKVVLIEVCITDSSLECQTVFYPRL